MDSATEIAKYILHFRHECQEPITNLKLQKLLYYVQGWHLGLYHKPAFAEPLQAWVHGPVQPAVYAAYKKYRWNPISEDVTDPEVSNLLAKHIDEVLKVYSTETAYALERMTHQEAPWKLARNGLAADMESTAEIVPQHMEEFFARIANE